MRAGRGVDTSWLMISDRAHGIMPWHRIIDRLDEELRGDAAIGTTGTGTGPAFHDKASRTGIRTIDVITPGLFEDKLRSVLDYKNRVLTKLYDADPLSFDEIRDQYRAFGDQLRPFIADTATVVQDAHERGERILLEGAQGTLLDLDSGTYPFVTSSIPASVAAGAGIGIGLGPGAIERVVGVYKAYQTRVGNGPMPTELFDETADRLRDPNTAQGQGEYGATTGRSRRCGWFDGVLARYTSRLNGVTPAALTPLDALASLDPAEVCTAPRPAPRPRTAPPPALPTTQALRPIYEELPGWKQDISGVRKLGDLPTEARQFVRRIPQFLGLPIDMISAAPARNQVLVTRDIFAGAL